MCRSPVTRPDSARRARDQRPRRSPATGGTRMVARGHKARCRRRQGSRNGRDPGTRREGRGPCAGVPPWSRCRPVCGSPRAIAAAGPATRDARPAIVPAAAGGWCACFSREAGSIPQTTGPSQVRCTRPRRTRSGRPGPGRWPTPPASPAAARPARRGFQRAGVRDAPPPPTGPEPFALNPIALSCVAFRISPGGSRDRPLSHPGRG